MASRIFAFWTLLVAVIVGVLAGALFWGYRTSDTAVFGDVSLTLEYATTTAARELGLGGRMNVPEGYGMLFVFPKSGRYGFWMKDMQVPIDIFWLDTQGRVISISEQVATSSYPDVFYPAAPAQYVLETAAGFAKAHGIATGTPLQLKDFPSVSK